MDKSSISVALCTYNGEKFLQEQLDSILCQNSKVHEIVICDDCSIDETATILKNYQKEFPEIIRLFFNEKNLGYVRNFEKALSLCKSDLIFLCDQDDFWFKHKTQKVLQFLENNLQIGVVAHDVALTGTAVREESFWDLKNFREKDKTKTNEELLALILTEGNIFPGMTLAIRREFLQQNLPLQKVDSIIIHDYELVIKALRDHQFGIIEEKLCAYRQHENQSIGYKEKKITAENDLKEIHLLSQQYLRIKNYTEVFQLDQNIGTDFQAKIKEKYSVFLKQFPFFKRIYLHLKNKYYYKIIHF